MLPEGERGLDGKVRLAGDLRCAAIRPRGDASECRVMTMSVAGDPFVAREG